MIHTVFTWLIINVTPLIVSTFNSDHTYLKHHFNTHISWPFFALVNRSLYHCPPLLHINSYFAPTLDEGLNAA